ncbi:hypothetical protein Dimus_015450 [Dionaea muscipula]
MLGHAYDLSLSEEEERLDPWLRIARYLSPSRSELAHELVFSELASMTSAMLYDSRARSPLSFAIPASRSRVVHWTHFGEGEFGNDGACHGEELGLAKLWPYGGPSSTFLYDLQTSRARPSSVLDHQDLELCDGGDSS